MTFTADQVWGLAVRADVQNQGEYLKEDRWGNDGETVKFTHTANKKLIKKWLHENCQPTEQEVTAGQEYRRFFNTYTLKALMGKLSDFERQALRIAQMDQFESNHMLEFAIVSCLPSISRREQARTELKREIFTATQIVGKPGDHVQGCARIISCNFSDNYGRYRVTAQMEESFVDFWFSEKLEGAVTIRAKIKHQRSDNTTQLNYVKVDSLVV
jgi:hypothetical protein